MYGGWKSSTPALLSRLYGKPAIFLANHQVGVESILFNVALSALSGVPIKVIAKKEHRQTWIGKLIELARSYPGVQGPELILFFDRVDPRALLSALAEYRAGLPQSPASLMVHVEGTRALSCRTPVSQVSSVFLDLALDMNVPVIPVRFVGGLPVEPVEKRLEFPFGGGRQDIRIGAPILPEMLRNLSLVERSKTVLDSINAARAREREPVSSLLEALDLRIQNRWFGFAPFRKRKVAAPRATCCLLHLMEPRCNGLPMVVANGFAT